MNNEPGVPEPCDGPRPGMHLAYVDRLPSVASLAASYHAADYNSPDDAADAHVRKIGYSYA